LQAIKVRPEATQFTFIFDNHSTQKSYTLIAFFEWIRKLLNPSKADATKILLVFLLHGHTHNRLDQKNSEPRRQYFTAEHIETIPEYVCQ